MHMPLFDSFPTTIAINDIRNDVVYNHAALSQLICNALRNQFEGRVTSEETVVVGCDNPVEGLTLLFASWANGNKVVLVNPGLKPIEQEIVVKHTGAAHWFGQSDISIQPMMETNRLGDAANQHRHKALDIDAPALVLMTSGTTGTPKGIVHTIRSLKSRLSLNLAFLPPEVLENSLCVLPLFFGHGLIGNCLTPLAAGKTLSLWTTPSIIEMANFGQILDEHGITFMSSVPTFWRLALKMEPPKRPALKRVNIGSAPLAVSHWQAVKDWSNCPSIYNMYGMTETANWTGGGDLAHAKGRDGYVGHIWGGRFAIRTDDGNIASQGRGEVVVDTPSIMVEYLNAPDTTQAALENGWFRTGDIGEIDSLGELVLVGRSKTEINRGGIKILAEEVDMMLERHDAIAEACAFGMDDAVSGEMVAAAVVLNSELSITKGELRKWCQTQVRAEAVPSKLFFVESIPKNDRGKIVRHDVMHAVTGVENDQT